MMMHQKKTLLVLFLTIFSLNSNFAALNLSYGLSSRQGTRPAMEDEHVHIIEPHGGLFAVFDGHKGKQASQLAAKNLPIIFSKNKNDNDIAQSLRTTFLQLDALILKKATDKSGTTAVVAYVSHDPGYGDSVDIAWAGDSRALLIKNPKDNPKLKNYTKDHKPIPDSDEAKRLEKVFGLRRNPATNKLTEEQQKIFNSFVAFDKGAWRLSGLAVSRALGDKYFKDKLQKYPKALIANADDAMIQSFLSNNMIVLACDGLWDVFSNEQVMAMIQKALQATAGQANQAALVEALKKAGFDENNALGAEKVSEHEGGTDGVRLQLIARALRNAAFNKGSGDNISVMLIEYPGTNPQSTLSAHKKAPTKIIASRSSRLKRRNNI